MKHLNKIKSLLFVFFASISLFSSDLRAHTSTPSCDTCTSTWSPITQKKYDNQSILSLPGCLFTFYLDIQTRLCNGKVEIRLVGQSIVSQCNGCPCMLNCYNVGPIMERITKRLLIEYGGNIILSKPSACYYLLEYRLSPALKTCLAGEAGNFIHWYAVLPCDPTGCCVTEFILQADGRVRAITTASAPCNTPPPSTAPTTITVYCWSMGVRTPYVVNVVPPSAPLTCEVACSAAGNIFNARTTDIDEQETIFEKESTIYPNPATDELNILGNTSWKDVVIMDMQGRAIETYTNPGKTINIKKLVPGTYLILLESPAGNKEKHVMIKK